jgi:hypothetical protein
VNRHKYSTTLMAKIIVVIERERFAVIPEDV